MHPATTPKLAIVIGENHPDLAESLSMLIDFQDDMRSVGYAASCAGIEELGARENPDVYLLDLSLDDGSSIPLIRRLRGARPDVVIVAFTGLADDVVTDQCVKAGCDRVVGKAGAIDELLDTIREAALERGRGAP